MITPLFYLKKVNILNNKYKCESVRLCRFLYSLGFNKESRFDKNNKEYWLFERSQELQNSLDFFFSMRKKLKIGVYDANGEKDNYRKN